MAMGGLRAVEGHRHMLRSLGLQKFPEHLREPEGGIGRDAAGSGQSSNGVKRTKEVGRAVDEVNLPWRGTTHDLSLACPEKVRSWGNGHMARFGVRARHGWVASHEPGRLRRRLTPGSRGSRIPSRGRGDSGRREND